MIFIPFLCSSAVTGVVWRELLNGRLPPVEGFFHLFGISPALLLGNVKTAWIVVGLVDGVEVDGLLCGH
jgi:multiple sugar transport system permease protein